MNNKNKKLTLLYNLIIFDFILLESSTVRISNFFIEKVKKQKNLLLRLPIDNIIKSFKQFIKLFNYINNMILIKKKKNTIYFWANSEYIIDFYNLFFKKYNISCSLKFNTNFPAITPKSFLSSALIFGHLLSKKNMFSFHHKNLNLIQTITPHNTQDFFTYKILSNLEDYKKLIFLGLLITSIFKY